MMMVVVQRLIFYALIFSLISCSYKDSNDKLIGKWQSIDFEDETISFTSEQIEFEQIYQTNTFRYHSKDSIIYYRQLTNIDPRLPVDFEMKYWISNDSLYLKKSDDYQVKVFVKK